MIRMTLLIAALGLLLWYCSACRERDAPSAGGHGHSGESAEEHEGHAHAEAEAKAPDAETEPGHAEEADSAHAGHAHEEGEAQAEGGHEGHDHAELVSLTPEQVKAFGVKTAPVAGGQLEVYLTLPGEVAVNADRVGHVLPKLGGVLQAVKGNIGDSVRKGQLLAVVESRELAQAKAEFLAARERETAARATADRERALFEKGVSPEQDFINADNAAKEAGILLRAAEQALHALGISEKELEALVAAPHESLTRYEIYAPLGGRILEKHAAIGEVVSSESELFLIADLSSVWVHLNASQQDLPRLREGQGVRIRLAPATGDSTLPDAAEARGRIKAISALVAEDTRTAEVRIELPNADGQWRPGMFVTGLLAVDQAPAELLIPLSALIKYEGKQCVFVQDDHGFEPRPVETGRQSATQAEVLSGLEAGETVVVEGAFTVKAELGKREAGHGH